MSLSITPTVAWDFTQGTPDGLTSVLGSVGVLTNNGGTLDADGHLATANPHYLREDSPPAEMMTSALTFVTCVDLSADIPDGGFLMGFRDVVEDRWALGLRLATTGGDPTWSIIVNGGLGGRYSTAEIETINEAVIVMHLSTTVGKIWYNGSLVFNGSGGTTLYDAVTGYLNLNAAGISTGSQMKFAAFYAAEPTSDDITALGSSLASSYAAVFDEAPAPPAPTGLLDGAIYQYRKNHLLMSN